MTVNFKRLLTLLLPTFLRRASTFFNAISTAFQSTKTNIDIFFRDLNYHVRVTPQTFSLEKMLNDKCDPLLRRIRVAHPAPEPPFYFTQSGGTAEMQYFGGENMHQYFMEKTAYAYDFAVYVPLALKSANMTNYITALLNKYAIITKSFLIFYE